MKKALRIGVSASMMHPDPDRELFKGKRLLYMEESMAHLLMNEGAYPILIPTSSTPHKNQVRLVDDLDGLLMSGGVDVSPTSYGESPLKDDWQGDKLRDDYEISLLKRAFALNMPVFGICRGIQLINVALGGTLYQDIETQVPKSFRHRNWEKYDQNFHEIDVHRDSALSDLYPQSRRFVVNSIHHQGINTLAPHLVAEATSSTDGMIECVYLNNHPQTNSYCRGVQWHPEFTACDSTVLMESGPLIRDFLTAAADYQQTRPLA